MSEQGNPDSSEQGNLEQSLITEKLAELQQLVDQVKARLAEVEQDKKKIADALAEAQSATQSITGQKASSEATLSALKQDLSQGNSLLASITGISEESTRRKAETDDFYAKSTEVKAAIAAGIKQLSDLKANNEKISSDFTQFKFTKEDEINKLKTTKEEELEKLKSTKEEELVKWKTSAESEYSEIKTRIETLIAGATGVGLAKSFEARRATYIKPKYIWMIAGGASLALLVIVPVWKTSNILDVTTWNQFFLVITRKLPVVLPLFFAAYYSFHQYGILAKIEEEYAHKVAVSAAFEGYKKELLSMLGTRETDPDILKNLSKLTNNALDAIARQTAEIYDTKKQPELPIQGLSASGVNSLEEILQAVQKQQSEQKTQPTGLSSWATVGASLGSALLVLLAWLITKLAGH